MYSPLFEPKRKVYREKGSRTKRRREEGIERKRECKKKDEEGRRVDCSHGVLCFLRTEGGALSALTQCIDHNGIVRRSVYNII